MVLLEGMVSKHFTNPRPFTRPGDVVYQEICTRLLGRESNHRHVRRRKQFSGLIAVRHQTRDFSSIQVPLEGVEGISLQVQATGQPDARVDHDPLWYQDVGDADSDNCIQRQNSHFMHAVNCFSKFSRRPSDGCDCKTRHTSPHHSPAGDNSSSRSSASTSDTPVEDMMW